MNTLIHKIVKIKHGDPLYPLVLQLKKIYPHFQNLRLFVLKHIDNLRGLDFIQEVSLEQLGLTKDASESYQASRTRRIKYVFRNLNIKPTDSIIDLGCGKGKLIHVAASFPFKRIDGVEISNFLCEIANKNISILKITNSEIYNCDASKFKDLDNYNFFYFNNPFPARIMAKVMRNINDNLSKFPRKVTIIYNIPLYSEEITKSGIFKLTFNYWSVNIYENDFSK